MHADWLFIALLFCAAAQIALTFGQRDITSNVLKMLRITVAIALAGFATAAAFQAYEKGQATSSMQSRLEALRVRQADLRSRFDALLTESEKSPNDAAILQSLGARHRDLAKEDDALKKDVDQLQTDLNQMKR